MTAPTEIPRTSAPPSTHPCVAAQPPLSPPAAKPSISSETQNKAPLLAPRCRLTWMEQNDLILLIEVRKVNAHTAAHSAVLKLFDTVAACSNKNSAFVGTVNGRKAHERFKKLLNVFEAEERRDWNRSKTGGELNEAEEILRRIVEDIEHEKEMKEVEQEGQSAATKRKVNAGARLLALANGTRVNDEALASECDGINDGPELTTISDIPTLRGPKRRRPHSNNKGNTGLEQFGEALKKSDLARIELDAHHLDFEKRKHEDMMAQRKRDRQAHISDRDQAAQADLERLKILLNSAMKRISPASSNHPA